MSLKLVINNKKKSKLSSLNYHKSLLNISAQASFEMGNLIRFQVSSGKIEGKSKRIRRNFRRSGGKLGENKRKLWESATHSAYKEKLLTKTSTPSVN
jgi:hypothetical protein